MNIFSEDEISGDVARALRSKAGLTGTEFWGAVGVNQSSGHRYENGTIKRDRMPRPVRILIFLKYVVALPINANNQNWTVEFTNLVRLGQKQRAVLQDSV